MAPASFSSEPTTTRRAAAAVLRRAASGGNRGGLHIGEAARAALRQPPSPLPSPSPSPPRRTDIRAALVISAAEEEANWPHLRAAIRTSEMEQEARPGEKPSSGALRLGRRSRRRRREEAAPRRRALRGSPEASAARERRRRFRASREIAAREEARRRRRIVVAPGHPLGGEEALAIIPLGSPDLSARTVNAQPCLIASKPVMVWKPELSEFVLNRLVQLVRSGVCFNMGFKEQHVKKIAADVLAFAGIQVTTLQLYNHIRNSRTKWSVIMKMKSDRILDWSEDGCFFYDGDEETAEEYVQRYPKHRQYVGTPITNYAQMKTIFTPGLCARRSCSSLTCWSDIDFIG
ncbi:hypothetical protein QYE76_068178 [Lolium multiflorum]|uniref:Myb/SANT-like domain-containing protein n=1 Tax=Lolium multiflorum TaxID=4521 RepID=A0AAD8WBP4_LOLMU|nr:hypothetical protein QYE76_068178 [Lolium multiflorum]